MAGLAAVPALPVGPARNIYSANDDAATRGEGTEQRYKMADLRLHGQAAPISSDSVNFYAVTSRIFRTLINSFPTGRHTDAFRVQNGRGRTHFRVDSR